METKTEEYRGFQIVATAMKDHDDLWDFKYHITDIANPAASSLGNAISRRGTLGGYTTPDTACDAGIEVAKIEVDNYIALKD